MQLRTRVPGGGTPLAAPWGVDSEYGILRDVLVGPVDHFTWQVGNAVAERAERVGLRFDFDLACRQYEEMLDVYRQADVTVHLLPASPELPYQIFARDSSVMTPWGAVIMQLQKPYRRGEYAACLRFYLDAGIPIYDLVTAGNVEGGDFMVLQPGVAACGYSGERSIEPAVRQLQSWFESEGWEFHTYAFDAHFLHLDVQIGMLAPGLASRRSSPSSSPGCEPRESASFRFPMRTPCNSAAMSSRSAGSACSCRLPARISSPPAVPKGSRSTIRTSR
jgi:hypothetical protein